MVMEEFVCILDTFKLNGVFQFWLHRVKQLLEEKVRGDLGWVLPKLTPNGKEPGSVSLYGSLNSLVKEISWE